MPTLLLFMPLFVCQPGPRPEAPALPGKIRCQQLACPLLRCAPSQFPERTRRLLVPSPVRGPDLPLVKGRITGLELRVSLHPPVPSAALCGPESRCPPVAGSQLGAVAAPMCPASCVWWSPRRASQGWCCGSQVRGEETEARPDHAVGGWLCQGSLPCAGCQADSSVLKTRLGRSEFVDASPACPHLDVSLGSCVNQKSKGENKNRGHERAPPEVSLQPRPALSSSSSGTGSWAVGLGESPAQSPWVQGMTSVSAGHKCHCGGTRGRKVAPHPGGPRQANDTTANKRIKATSQEAAWCQEKLMSSRRLPGLQGRLDMSKTRQCLLSPRPWEDTHTSQLQHHSFCIWGN